jgi:nitrous oxidase accessory protein NosD
MRLFVCVALIVFLAFAAAAADVSGKWSGSFKPDEGEDGHGFLILKQSGNVITGTGGPDEGEQWPILSGKIAGDKVSIEVKSPDNVIYKCELTLAGDSLKGDVVATGPDGHSMKGKLDLARVK